MPDYRRNRVPGDTYFLTVMRGRRSDSLVVEIAALRGAGRAGAASVSFRCLARVAGPYALPMDAADGRRGFFRAHARNQAGICPTDRTQAGADNRDVAVTGKRHLAEAI
jgi:hypothetical protein